MPLFAINHITVPRLGYAELFRLAAALGCAGVELRNDLDRPLFDGDAPGRVGQAAREQGLRIVGLSQVYPFNDWSPGIRDEVARLIETAQACGAETVSLIPRNDGEGTAEGERQENARRALVGILPMLEAAGMVALVEPLGFPTSSLRSKAETARIIDEVGGGDRFRLVHDTFHHHLAGEAELFPQRTGIVHVSGVVDPGLSVGRMRDTDRVLVDEDDRLDNLGQIAALVRGGYRGPISVEAFAPSVHDLPDPGPPLARMFERIRRAAEAAVA